MIRIVSACPQGVFQWQGRSIIVVMIRVFVTMLMTIVMAMAASPRQQRAGVFVVRQMQRHDERLHDQANRHQHSEKLRERRVACSRESHSGWRSLGASSFRRLTTLRLSRVAIQGGVSRASNRGCPLRLPSGEIGGGSIDPRAPPSSPPPQKRLPKAKDTLCGRPGDELDPACEHGRSGALFSDLDLDHPRLQRFAEPEAISLDGC